MVDKIGCSLIITTFNWPAALKTCLASVAWQSCMPDEVIIADDGSDNNTVELINAIRKDFPVPLVHLSHENIGKRKTRINNIAISRARFPYLVFIDHDIVLHPHFIKDHLALSERGFFVNGSRFLADEKSTNDFLAKDKFTPSDLQQLAGKNALNKLRAPILMRLLAHRYHTAHKYITEVRGCNMSFWKDDLIAVNGYDETYVSWGREDSNIAIRLFHSGIRKKILKFGGIGFHLHHRFDSREDDDVNLKMLDETMMRKEKWAKLGLDQHMKE